MFDGGTALRAPLCEWDGRFSMDMLLSHKDELREEVYALIESVSTSLVDLLTWRSPLTTLAVTAGWQLVGARPHLLPATLPLIALAYLGRTYYDATRSIHAPAVSLPPSASQLLKAAAGVGACGLTYSPPTHHTQGFPRCLHCGMFRSASGWRCSCTIATMGTIEEAVAKLLESSHDSVDGVEDLQRAQHAHHHSLESQHAAAAVSAEASERDVHPQRVARAGLLDVDGASLNPLAPYGGLLQQRLGTLLVYVRAIKRLLKWEDSALTLWLAVSCAATSSMLALLPSLISWQSQFRLLGLGLFGPHMMYIGMRRRLAERQAEALERRYQNAEAPEAMAMAKALAAERQRAAHEARQGAELQATSAWLARPAAQREQEQRRLSRVEMKAHRLRLYASRACSERFPLRPDPQQSHAWAMQATPESSNL